MAKKDVKTTTENNVTEIPENGDKETAIKNGDNFKTISLADTNYANASFGVTLEGDGGKKKDTQVIIKQSVTLNDMLSIVEETYQALMVNAENLYALKRPFLVFYILNSMSNVDVSDVVEKIEPNTENTENDTEKIENDTESVKNDAEKSPQYRLNADKLMALSVSAYGQVIDRMLDRTSGMPYNAVYVIGQLLDKRLEIFEKAVEGYSPSDNVLNEIYNAFSNLSTFFNTLTEKVNKFNVEKLGEQIADLNPQAIIAAYLNSKTAKDNKESVLQAKNEQIQELKTELNTYTARNVMADNVINMPDKGKK